MNPNLAIMKKYLIYLILIPLLHACIPPPVEIEVPQAESKLVIASQQLFNQGVIVQVSKSFNALTETPTEGDTVESDFLDFLLVDSALLTIEGPEGKDTLFPLDQGFYLWLGRQLVAGDTYRLSVYDSTTGQEVFAQTEVLPPASFNEVDYDFEVQRFDIADTILRDTTFRLDISFDDLPGENYYMVNLYRISQGQQQVSGNLFTLGQGQPTTTYTDALLQGNTFVDSLTYRGIGRGDTIGVTLSHISRVYYDYLLARERSGTSIFVSLLGEPVSFPSNVEGGYGFFNLFFPTTEVLTLE